MKEWQTHDFEQSFDVFDWLMIGEKSFEEGWRKKEWLGARENKKLEQKFASNFSLNFQLSWKHSRGKKLEQKFDLKL